MKSLSSLPLVVSIVLAQILRNDAFAVTRSPSSSSSTTAVLRPHSLSSRQHFQHHQHQHQRRQQHLLTLSSSSLSPESGDSLSSNTAVSDSSIASSSAAINGDVTTLVVLKEFEKKQSELAKRKQTALEQVQKFDSTLQQLEQKKQEYLNGLQLQKPALNFRETALRSVVKSFVWRVVAGLVTLITSLQFSGSLTTALSIVSSDFFSKAFTMFLGERLMDRSSAGRAKGADNVKRSLTKALVWRLFAICNTLTFAIFFSKDWSVAGKIAGTDALTKTFLMFVYERIWANIQWGKAYLIEFSI